MTNKTKEAIETIKGYRKLCNESMYLNKIMLWQMKKDIIFDMLYMILFFGVGILAGIEIAK